MSSSEAVLHTLLDIGGCAICSICKEELWDLEMVLLRRCEGARAAPRDGDGAGATGRRKKWGPVRERV